VVLSCVQDKAGFVWIVTQQGLNRYDGASCLVFQNETNNKNSLNYNNLSDLEPDSKGNFWIATFGGKSGGSNL